MTAKQVLTTAQNVLRGCKIDRGTRNSLIKLAVSAGRPEAAARKASTMRLAQWARGYKSAI